MLDPWPRPTAPQLLAPRGGAGARLRHKELWIPRGLRRPGRRVGVDALQPRGWGAT
jgi:hypothetical protein